MKFKITILGTAAAIPSAGRHPSAQLIELENETLLVDCGEGTQIQLRKYASRIQRISHIFISHLHGDHFFGLIGLLTTFHLLGRKKELHVYGFPPLKEIIDMQLHHSFTTLIYPLIFHPLEPDVSKVIMEDDKFSVRTIPLLHRVPACGFLVKEKPFKKNIRRSFVDNNIIPNEAYDQIRNGEDYRDLNGKVFKNEDITFPPPPPRSYAYCSDTIYTESIIPFISGVDLLFHETTFKQDMEDAAHEKFHSTTKEAATIAMKAKAGQLLIGHFSGRYKDTKYLLEESQEIFPDTIVAEEGLVIDIPLQKQEII